ncbi:hypothetical protein KW850_07050 [Bacillus sp. sid0103]|uniref:hypothetical protein n=1 Tax=Bacillus sp. sid0103 TaxID=2856337 RepID=UPI001C473444|nr:hypothetical protein [Bacillus sp. sid0103]MBV7505013.1 hypothetical protein [Bacillus sp. sid0103]
MYEMEKVLAFLFRIGLNALIILALLSLNGKINPHKKRLSILSLISTFIFTFIPTIVNRVDKDLWEFNLCFPAEGFVYRGGWDLTFVSFGFIFNFFFFYWVLKLILKLWKEPTVKN